MGGQNFEGLGWEKVASGEFGMEARFTRVPDLEAAKQLFKWLGVTDGEIDITLIETQQELSRVYDVFLPEKDETLILRINLPLDPRFKTLSEVETINWVRDNTNIPVPKIVHYDASNANPIGFEYILMTKLPGKQLSEEMWKSISFPAKEELFRQIAELSSCLYKNQLRGIGSIQSASPPSVGPVVARELFWHDSIHIDVPRGPFSSARDWFKAILEIKRQVACAMVAKHSGIGVRNEEDQEDLDWAQVTLKIIDGVVPLVDKILPPGNDVEDEPSMLHHAYLDWSTILVDDSGALTGIIDWQCASAVPLWSACYYPQYLSWAWREEKPEPENYGTDAEDDGGSDPNEPGNLYWLHMEEYECYLLRGFFLEEMARLEPGWVEIFKSSELKVDLEEAVINCDCEVGFIVSRNRELLEWIDKVNAEKPWAKKAEGLNG
ncbi:hypothetical protein V500_04381 [Pseudogymnoascus sp. VKM F-4518 (FW-2643)]|nr:hypothetical protein V500_04381 [Pseudogymnoascus sp. VKM F-4518 (FW-2643)]